MRTFRLAVALCALASIPTVISAGSEAALPPDEVEAIRSISERYVEAMRANDWPKVATFFATDAVRMPPNQPIHQGRDAIQQWLSQIDSLTEYTVTPEEIQGSGTMAYLRAKYTITLTLKGVDGPITDSGKAIEIWKKDSDGHWRMASAIWNSDLPIP